MDGAIILDKPQDFTSFDAVAVMRRLCHEKKIGHTGTLDPMATGVLPLLLGKATRAISLLEETGKEYAAAFAFGYETDTEDSTGTVRASSAVKVTWEQLRQVLPAFRGEIQQIPPMYSAVHKDGVRLYQLARKGIEVEREPRPVTIYKLECTAFDEAAQTGELTVQCSAGTYIRTLCADIAKAAGTLGVMTALRRTSAAGFSLEQCITLEQAKELSEQGTLAEKAVPIEDLFQNVPSVTVTAAQTVRFCNGGALGLERLHFSCTVKQDMRWRVYSPEQKFLGLGAIDMEKGELKILRLF